MITREAALEHTPKRPLLVAFALGCAAPSLLMSGLCRLPDRAWDIVIRALSWRPERG